MKKRSLALLLAGAMIVSTVPMSVFADETEASTSEDVLHVTDDVGGEWDVKLPVERVLPTNPSAYTILSAFGKLDTVVGNHQSIAESTILPEIQDIPVVATWTDINYEELAKLQPQVVISSLESHGYITENENLAAFDIQDLKLSLREPARMQQDIDLLGQIFGCEDKAAEIDAFYDKWQSFIDERVGGLSDEEKVKVFLEMHAGPFNTGAPGSAWFDQVALAGGINIAGDMNLDPGQTPEISAEAVAEANPDVIIREDAGLTYDTEDEQIPADIIDEILSRDALQTTNAVKNEKVFILGNDILSRPGYIVGVAYMAKWFYPDLFEDFEPADVYEEYINLFFPGKEVKGILAYEK